MMVKGKEVVALAAGRRARRSGGGGGDRGAGGRGGGARGAGGGGGGARGADGHAHNNANPARRVRLRLVKAHPGWRTYGRAMAAKRSVLQVIARTIVRDDQTGADRIMIGQGSSFVIKVNQQAQESFVLTSAHVMGDRLKPGDDGLCVRLMVPGGVLEFAATIIHSDGPMDVALLRVPGLTRATPLRFAPEDPVLGEGIAAVGYCNPENLFPVLSFTRKPAISPGRVRGGGQLLLSSWYPAAPCPPDLYWLAGNVRWTDHV